MSINKNTISYAAILTLLIITAVVSMRMFFVQRTDHDILDIRTFPYAIGEWKGKDLEIKDYEYEILETRNLISREYTNPKGENAYLFIIYSETNRSVFHPPEVCLLGSGVCINDKQTEEIDTGNIKFACNKLFLEKNGSKQIVLYCYKAGDLYTDNFYLQQLHFALNQLLGKRRGGATVRVSMPVVGSEEETLSELKRFLVGVVVALEKLT